MYPMDGLLSTFAGLLAALGIVAGAAVVSMWLLSLILPILFWAVVLANFMAVFMGVTLSVYATKDYPNRTAAALANVATAVSLSMLVCGLMVVGLADSLPPEEDRGFWFAKAMSTLFGVATDSSLLLLLLRWVVLLLGERRAELQRLGRRLWAACWAPRARALLFQDLEAAAPDLCAICLEALALPGPAGEQAPPPAAGRSCGAGVGPAAVAASAPAGLLLRLPCGHTFHAHCGEQWLEREATCPLCRRPAGGLGGGARPRPGPTAAAGGALRNAAAGADREASGTAVSDVTRA